MPRNRLLAPGPVPVPDSVRLAMARPVIHHRAPEFLPVFQNVRRDLKRVYQTSRDVLVLASSGTGGMEAAVCNFLSPGDKAVVVRGGKFGERWAELCETWGAEPICVDVEWGHAVDPNAVAAAFERAPEARALLVQASDTSTGVYHPIRELAEVAHTSPERLVIVDGITGIGVHDIPVDDWDLDVVVGGSQKAFMLPPGLAFVSLSERAAGQLDRATGPRFYFDLRKEAKVQPEDQTAYTPAVSLLYGLEESLRLILEEEGLQATFERHAALARATREAMTALGLRLFAPDSPSFACTAVCIPDGLDGKALIKRLRDAYGFTIAGGQGHVAGKIMRIGHMGYVDRFDTIAAVAAIEMALADMGWPVKLGEGTRTASELLREPGA